MTLYARADVMSVTVPAESGGCGAPHSRPVHEGVPAKTWGLSCPPCERYLERDIARDIGYIGRDGKQREHQVGMWAHNSQRIPLTPDQIDYVDAQKAAGERLTAERAAADAQTSAQVIAARQEADMQAMMAREQTAQAEARAAESERQIAELRRELELLRATNQYRDAAEWWHDGPRQPRDVTIIPDSAVMTMATPMTSGAPTVVTVAPPVTGPGWVTGMSVAGDVVKADIVRPGDEVAPAVAATLTCPECGGPLRKPGARGPLPKKCADCRGRRR